MKNKYLRLAVVVLPILLAVICLVQMVRTNNQSIMPIPREHAFIGEYSYDGENWYPYEEDSELSALEGDVIIKGHLDSDVQEGAMLNFYCNHIGNLKLFLGAYHHIGQRNHQVTKAATPLFLKLVLIKQGED